MRRWHNLSDGAEKDKLALWLTRAIRADPYVRLVLPPQEESWHWEVRPEDGMFRGRIYTDGSLLDGDSKYGGRLARLGWSFVVLDDDGIVRAAASGGTPAWIKSIHGAEL